VSGFRRLRRFFATPKGLLIVILGLLAAVAAPREGLAVVAPGLVSAVVVAGVLDAVILRSRRTRWYFPDGAVITALIVAMVLSAREPWYVVTITAAAAVLSKYAFRTRAANVFNPAALAMVVTFYLFDTGQSWWGALPEVPVAAQVLLFVTGAFISDRVNRVPLVLSFLGAYGLLFTTAAFAGDPQRVTEIFRTPDLQAALFFAFFILTDPPTSPVAYHDQFVYGLIVAGVSFAVFEWLGAAHYLLAGVLAGNIWEARQRVNRRRQRTPPVGQGALLQAP
jgi:Na+-translocating ferredoxin:NAD+ oxidoreductase RnfD subunit